MNHVLSRLLKRKIIHLKFQISFSSTKKNTPKITKAKMKNPTCLDITQVGGERYILNTIGRKFRYIRLRFYLLPIESDVKTLMMI